MSFLNAVQQLPQEHVGEVFDYFREKLVQAENAVRSDPIMNGII